LAIFAGGCPLILLVKYFFGNLITTYMNAFKQCYVGIDQYTQDTNGIKNDQTNILNNLSSVQERVTENLTKIDTLSESVNDLSSKINHFNTEQENYIAEANDRAKNIAEKVVLDLKVNVENNSSTLQKFKETNELLQEKLLESDKRIVIFEEKSNDIAKNVEEKIITFQNQTNKTIECLCEVQKETTKKILNSVNDFFSKD
jgi:uncharacterized protein YoxC